jgi:hypothetical protein
MFRRLQKEVFNTVTWQSPLQHVSQCVFVCKITKSFAPKAQNSSGLHTFGQNSERVLSSFINLDQSNKDSIPSAKEERAIVTRLGRISRA